VSTDATTAEALLAAVIAKPDDEALRRRFADAVAPLDPARAELIRLQLQLRDLRRSGATPPLRSLDRERALLAANGRLWAGKIGDLVWRYQFLRGFIEHITLTASEFLARAADIYRIAPVRHVTLSAARPQIARLAASPYLARLVSLDLSDNKLGDDAVRTLAGSGHLKQLRLLRLAKNELGRDAAEALVASTSLAGLAHLDFRHNKVDLTPKPAPIKSGAVEIPMLAHDLMSRYGRRRFLETVAAPRLDEL
jgi:uncharacterized protein (TIGR02996 family)